MNTISSKEDDATIRGQALFMQHMYSSLSIAAIRCAIELKIADIINNHGVPLTLTQIAHEINSPSLNLDGLSRLMRFLVRKQILDMVYQPESVEPLYSLNECSKWLLHDSRKSLAPLAMTQTDPLLSSPFYRLKQSIVEGRTVFMMTYGLELWDFVSRNPQLNTIFNEGMACFTRITMDAVLSNYDFHSVKGTMVDVGGGVGAAINEIVSAYPHIKGINIDLPHVISTAPAYEGVTHLEGDIINGIIPPAHTYFIKSVLHNWSDDKCVRVLKNCRDSIIEKSGKVIIVDIILNPEGDDVFDDARINLDMVMFLACDGGKERTEVEWKRILEESGFHRYKVIKIPAVSSVIEAYLD